MPRLPLFIYENINRDYVLKPLGISFQSVKHYEGAYLSFNTCAVLLNFFNRG